MWACPNSNYAYIDNVNVEQSQKSLFSIHNLVIYTPIKASSTKVAKKVGTAQVGHCRLAITYLHNYACNNCTLLL